MAYLVKVCTLLVQIGGMFSSVRSTFVKDVSSGEWEGVAFFISVKRGAIQNRLDAFISSVSGERGDGPRLFIPEVPVFPDFNHSDHHPVYISVGYMTSHDFDNYLETNPIPSVSVSGLEVAVTIPLLAGFVSSKPIYALALAKFYDRSRGDIPKTNFIYPYIPVDEIKMNHHGAVVRNGSEELRISFERYSHSCKPPSPIVREEFEDFILSDFQFGLPEPDYSFCERHSFKSKFCSKAEVIKCGVSRYAPNLCQMWRASGHYHCVTNVEILNITSGFRDFILLHDDPISILASEVLHYNFQIALKYPCQD